MWACDAPNALQVMGVLQTSPSREQTTNDMCFADNLTFGARSSCARTSYKGMSLLSAAKSTAVAVRSFHRPCCVQGARGFHVDSPTRALIAQ
jgi:hypothetical protein